MEICLRSEADLVTPAAWVVELRRGENGTPLQEMIGCFHMLSLKFAPFQSLRVGSGSLLHTGMY